jgi:hypothetical protein
MAATTLDRNTQKRGPIRQQVLALAAASTGANAIPVGVMVMTLTAGTGALNAADTATGLVAGLSCQVGNFANGDRKLVVEKGIFKMANNGSITAANVGTVATVVDNQTVGLAADTTNDVGAGIIDSVESDGVWIDMTGARVAAT